MEIFISGPTGFFGTSFLNTLSKNFKKYSFINSITLFSRPQSISIVHKLVKKTSLDKFFNINIIEIDPNLIKIPTFNIGQSVDKIFFHFAAKSVFESNNAEDFLDSIQKINSYFFDICSKYSINRIIYSSSGAVYGERNRKIKIVETDNFILDPSSKSYLYQQSKIASEKFFLNLAKINNNLDIRIARCFTFFGESLDILSNYAITNFINNCRGPSKIINIKSDGQAFRSYLYEEDLVDFLFKIAISEFKNEIFNVGSDSEISILELAKLVNNLACNGEAKINIEFNKSKDNYYIPNIEKARCLLKFKETVSLKESLMRYFDVYF